MMPLKLSIVFATLKIGVLLAEEASAANYLPGCYFPSTYSTNEGFDMKYYTYPANSPKYLNSAFYVSGYLNNTLKGSATGVETLSYNNNWVNVYSPYSTKLPDYFNYKGSSTFDSFNFAMVGTGYFYAPENGTYKFQLKWADDYSIISFGADNAFPCCKQQTGSQTTINSAETAFTDFGHEGSGYLEVDLLAGSYYPIKILYVNIGYLAVFDFQFQAPSMSAYSSVYTGYVFSGPQDAEKVCDNPIITTTKSDLSSYDTKVTSTMPSVSSSDKMVTTNTTAKTIVSTPSSTFIPKAATFTTTGIKTTTVTGITAMTTITVTTDVTNTVNDEVTVLISETVEVPITYESSTFINRYSGSDTSTYSVGTITNTDPNGMIIVSTIYYVDSPVFTRATTILTYGVVSVSETYSTAVYTVTGDNGIQTDVTVYYVKTPSTKHAVSGTISLVVSNTTEPSSGLATLGSSKGQKLVPTITSYIYSTIYRPAFVSSKNTYATSAFTTLGFNGNNTVYSIFYVETPIITGVSSVYSFYNGTTTTTYSTTYWTGIGADGKKTISTTFYIQTPIFTNVTSSSSQSTSSYTPIITNLTSTSSAASEYSKTSAHPTNPSTQSRYSARDSTFTGANGKPATSKTKILTTPGYDANTDTQSSSFIVSTLSSFLNGEPPTPINTYSKMPTSLTSNEAKSTYFTDIVTSTSPDGEQTAYTTNNVQTLSSLETSSIVVESRLSSETIVAKSLNLADPNKPFRNTMVFVFVLFQYFLF